MKRQEVLEALCALVSDVGSEVFENDKRHDCICGGNPYATDEHRVDDDIIDFIGAAVREKIDGAKPNLKTLPALVKQLQYRKMPAITSICIVKDAYGMGLKEAKDAYEAEVARSQAEQFKKDETIRIKNSICLDLASLGRITEKSTDAIRNSVEAL